MARLQVSEKVIKNKYVSLDKYLNKEVVAAESNLFYQDGKVYKIFKPIYRLSREKYLWMLEANHFNNAINIEDELYQGDKVIGCTTILDENFIPFADIFTKCSFDLKILKEYLKALLNLDQELFKYNLAYLDKHLNNIGLSNQNLKVLDLDGVWYNAPNSYKTAALRQSYHVFLALLLKERRLIEEVEFLKTLPFNYFNLEQMQKYINNMSLSEAQDLQYKYKIYKKNR